MPLDALSAREAATPVTQRTRLVLAGR